MPDALPNLFIALDCDIAKAAEIVARIGIMPEVGFKIGPVLLAEYGPNLHFDNKLFFDLKLHDTARIVHQTVLTIAERNPEVCFVTVWNDKRLIEAANKAALDSGSDYPLIIGVNQLSDDPAERMSVPENFADLEGLVVPAAHLADFLGPDLVDVGRKEIISPGIRLAKDLPLGPTVDDHSELRTPRWAMRHGATRLVVGRPIVDAEDPRSAALAYLTDMAEA